MSRLGRWAKASPRRALAAAGLVVCVVAWPVTSLTVFRSEPQGVLALSWLAIMLTLVDIVTTAAVRDDQAGSNGL